MSQLLDHRQIAGEMEIFVLSEQIGAGLPIWLASGVAIRDELEAFVKELERLAGYQRVVSPHLAREELYAKSGHLQFYREDMFPPLEEPGSQKKFFLKPMNCPHHHLVFGSSPRSYRHLPFRVAEYGQVYRYEPSGSLKGLSRVRGLCQNDAHIYLAPHQALGEIRAVLRLHEHCYKALGICDYRYRLSLHDPARPSDFEGDPGSWLEAEKILREALRQENLEHFEAVGEAAFYGPKIDVQMRFVGGHEESLASVQLDFLSAVRFGLGFVSSAGKIERPWIIHRAPLGSHERFVAYLLEHYQGRLPGWLCPIQALVLPVSESEREYAENLASKLREWGLRAKVDLEQGSLSKRIAIAHRQRPFAKIIVGPAEAESGELEVQLRESREKVSAEGAARLLQDRCRRPPLSYF